VLTEGLDIDLVFEAPVYLPSDVESSSKSEPESDHDSECDDPLPKTSKFMPNHTRNRNAIGTSWEKRKPPTALEALDALNEIRNLLRPAREAPEGKRRYMPSKIKGWSKGILKDVQCFLNLFTGDTSKTKGQWTKASEQAAAALNQTSKNAPKTLREHARKFITTKKTPNNPYGTWTKSLIDTDEEFAQEINIYLQSKGKYVKASDISIFLNDRDIQRKWGLKKTIGKATAKRWMKKLGYRWVMNHKGQYVDGHERDDVIKYRQDIYLPRWYELQPRMRTWDNDGIEEPLDLSPGIKPVVPHFHDESIYYANDRRTAQWVHEDASPTPYAKGEGASMMTAQFFSPDHGYLRSPDGKEDSRVIFRPGKNRDGYFDNEDIILQATMAMDVCEKYYPNEKHIFIFDNATTHLKRAENALSARKMPKFTPKEGSNWGIEVSKRGIDGKIEYGSDGKPLKVKIKMGHGYFTNGTHQDFYYPEDHPRAGVFKGMAVILQERGYTWANDLRAECSKFKCPPDATRCCCRRILYMEPDFVNVKSLLEEHCVKRGFEVLFLPKFHCELNPLEMVWGRSKFWYRLNPPSTKEEDLQANMIESLEKVTIGEMRRYLAQLSHGFNLFSFDSHFSRYSRRSRRFTDAYHHGLTGRQAIWASKIYRGHRSMPTTLMEDMEREGLS
jgi:transposase